MDHNQVHFIGKVKQHEVKESGGKKSGTIVLTLKDRVLQNKQWVDHFMDVLCFTNDEKKIPVIEKWVKDGQELGMDLQYLNWESGGVLKHGFRIITISLGYAPKAQDAEGEPGSEFPE